VVELELQFGVAEQSVIETFPTRERLQLAIEYAADGLRDAAAVNLRVTDEAEMSDLNQRFRAVNAPTNVLAFPVGGPRDRLGDFVGDLVVCAPRAMTEAAEQGKLFEHHCLHLVVHGVLHLLGFDHVDDEHAEVMEGREREVLSKLGISDPYKEQF
tara:strand:- start:137 stop:604 length:468 start_codon:yes stop_codon:yes gene_type:complete